MTIYEAMKTQKRRYARTRSSEIDEMVGSEVFVEGKLSNFCVCACSGAFLIGSDGWRNVIDPNLVKVTNHIEDSLQPQ